jgi:hypothetical protein
MCPCFSTLPRLAIVACRPRDDWLASATDGFLGKDWRAREPKGRRRASRAFEQQGKIVDVSWSTLVGLDRRELMGLEADMIAAHRKLHGNPACQFHGQPQLLAE